MDTYGNKRHAYKYISKICYQFFFSIVSRCFSRFFTCSIGNENEERKKKNVERPHLQSTYIYSNNCEAHTLPIKWKCFKRTWTWKQATLFEKYKVCKIYDISFRIRIRIRMHKNHSCSFVVPFFSSSICRFLLLLCLLRFLLCFSFLFY